jgi:hypothetical protein
VQRAAPVRVSAPIPAGGGSYKLIAGMGDRPVGSVMVHAGTTDAAEVTDLGVEQAHRAQGIGKQLIASAARTGQQLGKARLALAAQDEGSGRLTQWYKRMGFAQVVMHPSGHPQLEAPIGRVLSNVVQRRVAPPQAMHHHIYDTRSTDREERQFFRSLGSDEKTRSPQSFTTLENLLTVSVGPQGNGVPPHTNQAIKQRKGTI